MAKVVAEADSEYYFTHKTAEANKVHRFICIIISNRTSLTINHNACNSCIC